VEFSATPKPAPNSSPDPAAPPALVMGFGNTGERAIEPAIAAIADLLR
jgi:hypothetical protein